MANDHVETILAEWRRERPDLDASPMAVIGRVSRLSRHLETRLERNYRRFGLQGGRFDLLATLRRSGPPYALTPTQLQHRMMLTSGATTHRIDLLEREGMVERRPDPEDRRGVQVRLTTTGMSRLEAALASHLELERDLLKGLNQEERSRLAELLGILAEANGL
jgi:DNA-binding MarR family transcriptional regulator